MIVLKPFEIEIGDGQQRIAPLRLRHRLVHAVGEQRAIRQRRQHVVMRDVFELLLVFLDRGDVREQCDVLAWPALRVVHGADVLHFGVQVAVLAPVPDLAVPMAVVDQAAPQFGVERPILAAGVKEARIAPERFFAAVAGDAREGLVDVDDLTIGVGDHDAFACVGKDARRQLELVFGLLAPTGVDTDSHQVSLLRRLELDAGQEEVHRAPVFCE